MSFRLLNLEWIVQFNQKTRTLRHYLSPIFYIIALVFMTFAVWKSIDRVNIDLRMLDYHILGSVFVGVFFSVWLGAINWVLIANMFNFNGKWSRHISTHLTSNIAKYLPGAVWGFLNKGILSGQVEQSRKIIVSAISLELILAIFSGTAIALFAGAIASVILPLDSFLREFWILAGIITLVTAYAILILLTSQANTRQFWHQILQRKVILIFGVLIINLFLGWSIQSIGLQQLAKNFTELSFIPTAYWIFAYSLSVVVGILVLFVPTGLGVREGVLLILFGKMLPFSVIIISAVLLRIITIFAEFAAFLTILVLNRVFTQNNRIGVL